MGGTCLNRGCIPSKMLIHSAEVALQIQKTDLQNIKIPSWSCDFQALVKRVSNVIDKKSDEMMESYENYPNLDLYSCQGKLISPHLIKVGDKEIQGDQIFLSVGARPYIPKIPGLPKTPYITSTEALRLLKKPKHVVILGGGYIAAELGFYFSALGIQTTILVNKFKMLSREDVDV